MMVNTFTCTERAASFLANHLNNDYYFWLKFLKNDQRRVEKNRDIPIWGIIHDSVCYDVSELCRYVARRNPTALGYPANNLWGEICAPGSTYSVDVQVNCDYEQGGQFTVRLSEPENFYGKREITPEVARKLGHQLLAAADYCKQHVFDHEEWKIVPKAAETALVDLVAAKLVDLRMKGEI